VCIRVSKHLHLYLRGLQAKADCIDRQHFHPEEKKTSQVRRNLNGFLVFHAGTLRLHTLWVKRGRAFLFFPNNLSHAITSNQPITSFAATIAPNSTCPLSGPTKPANERPQLSCPCAFSAFTPRVYPIRHTCKLPCSKLVPPWSVQLPLLWVAHGSYQNTPFLWWHLDLRFLPKLHKFYMLQRARCERTRDFALAHIRHLSEILLNQVTHHLW